MIFCSIMLKINFSGEIDFLFSDVMEISLFWSFQKIEKFIDLYLKWAL